MSETDFEPGELKQGVLIDQLRAALDERFNPNKEPVEPRVCKCGCGSTLKRRTNESPSRFKTRLYASDACRNKGLTKVVEKTCGCGKPIIRARYANGKLQDPAYFDKLTKCEECRKVKPKAAPRKPRPAQKREQPKQAVTGHIEPPKPVQSHTARKLPDPKPRVMTPDSAYGSKKPSADIGVNLLEEERAAKRAAGIRPERGGPYRRVSPELKRALGRALRLHGPDFIEVWKEVAQAKAASGHDLSPYPGTASA